MGSRTQLTYFLPTTKVRLRAEVTNTTDTILPGPPARHCPGLTLDLVVVADRDRPRSLIVDSGMWRDYSFQVSLTEDGRLARAGVESTGQTVRALGGLTAAAVGAVALATGSFPVAAAAGVAAGVLKAGPGPAPDRLPPGRPDKDTTPNPVADAYSKAYPDEAARLAALTIERQSTVAKVDTARASYLNAVDDPAEGTTARAAYRSTREVLRDVEAELANAKTHFTAWRRETLKQTHVHTDIRVPLSSLPTFSPTTGLEFTTDAPGARVRQFFDTTGTVVARWDDPSPAAPAATGSDPEQDQQAQTGALHVLRPREITLVSLAGDTPDTVTVNAVHRELVMDHSSEELHLPVRKSWNARRRTDIELSAMGALIGLELNGTSSASAAAASAAEIAPSIAAALETASKATAAADALANADRERELPGLKRLVAVQEQRLLAAGQAATADDYAHLAKLRQAVEAAELETTLAAAKTTLRPAT